MKRRSLTILQLQALRAVSRGSLLRYGREARDRYFYECFDAETKRICTTQINALRRKRLIRFARRLDSTDASLTPTNFMLTSSGEQELAKHLGAV